MFQNSIIVLVYFSVPPFARNMQILKSTFGYWEESYLEESFFKRLLNIPNKVFLLLLIQLWKGLLPLVNSYSPGDNNNNLFPPKNVSFHN